MFDDKREELKTFHSNPAWSRLVDRMPDEKVAKKLEILRKARECRAHQFPGNTI